LKLYELNSPEEFLENGEAFLEESESLNNLFLGLANRLSDKNPDEGESFFIIVKNDLGEVEAAAMRSAPVRPLILSEAPKAAIELIADHLKAKNIELAGSVGPRMSVESFGSLWSNKYSEVMDQGVYECKKLIAPQRFVGSLFKVSLDNQKALEMAVKFGAGFIEECFPKHREPLVEARKAIEFYVEKGCIYLWQDANGEFVSMAANHRDSKNAGTIGWVYTPVEKRGQGFGSMVTHGVTQEIFNKGKTLANLFTDMSNPTSNSIYQKIGYQLIGHSAHIEF
jgi:hypothetical protein